MRNAFTSRCHSGRFTVLRGPAYAYRSAQVIPKKTKIAVRAVNRLPEWCVRSADSVPQRQATDAVPALFLRMAKASGFPRKEIL
jgi:hypothetical protein